MARKSGEGPAAALFDVDGTLVDTNYLNTVTWWEAFSQAGHDIPMAQIHRAIGMGSDQMLDKLLPANRDKDADAGIRTAHGALYAVYWSRFRPLPDAVSLLRACKKRGLVVVLASSADEPEFNNLRRVLDAEDAIDAATFAGDVEASKPAPDLVEAALSKIGVPAAEAVFVGDTVWDVQASKQAGVPCIGLLSGGFSRDELASEGAAEIYSDASALLAALPRSMLGG
jgi:HAD superfamily hydrolase (TIGR01509 family)